MGEGEDVGVPPPTDGGAVADGGNQRRPDLDADGKGIAWPPPVGVLGGALVLGGAFVFDCASSDGWCDGLIRVSSRNPPCVRGKVGLTCTISTANPNTPTTRQTEPTTCQPSNPCKRIQRQKERPSRTCSPDHPFLDVGMSLFSTNGTDNRTQRRDRRCAYGGRLRVRAKRCA